MSVEKSKKLNALSDEELSSVYGGRDPIFDAGDVYKLKHYTCCKCNGTLVFNGQNNVGACVFDCQSCHHQFWLMGSMWLMNF